MLANELERAEVVSSERIPSDVITMDSRARVRNLDSAEQTEYTLVFPIDADINENKISILAPIGTALLGYRAGDEIVWPVPGGIRRLKVEEVVYQPESDGQKPEKRAPRREQEVAA
jgi:regulator of nucleoside diphosphate kinase